VKGLQQGRGKKKKKIKIEERLDGLEIVSMISEKSDRAF